MKPAAPSLSGSAGEPSSPADLLLLTGVELARIVAAGLPLCAECESPASWVEALRDLASHHYFTDAAQARRIARRALELAELLDDPVAIGWGYRATAEAALFSGRMKEAEAAYAQAESFLAKSRAPGASALLGQLLVGRIHVLSLLGQHEAAARAGKEARRRLEAAKDYTYLAKLAMNLGNAHFQQEEHGPALREYERAAVLFRDLGVRDQSVLGLETNRAIALMETNQHEEAMALFSELEKECGERGFDLLRAQVWMNAAYLQSLCAEFDLALRYLGEATTYFRTTEHPAFLATCELNRADIYQQLNLHQDAFELAEAAAPRFASEGLRYDEALATSQAALSCLALDDIDAAVERIRRARRLFAKEANQPRAAVMELLWAEALARRDRPRAAAARAQAASASFRALGLVRWEASAAVLLARVEAPRLGPARQIRRLRKLLRRLPGRLYPIPAYRLLDSLGQMEERAGRPREAQAAYRQALTRLESLRVRIPTEDSKIAFLGDKTHLHDRLLSLELAKSRPSAERLFEWMERSRAQSLWDRLRSPEDFRVDASADQSAESSSPRRHLAWLHSRLSRLELGSAEEHAQLPALRRRVAEAELALTRHLRGEQEAGGRRGGAPAAAESDPARVPSLSEISHALPEGWGFLSYHLGPDFSLVLAITQQGVAWRRLSDDLSPRLTSLADRLDFQWGAAAMTTARTSENERRSSADGTASPATAGATRLLQSATEAILKEVHALLWAPIEELKLPRDLRWVISPHGPVHRIPFHALLGADGYLVDASDLAITPSARIFRSLPTPRRNPGSALVAGVPSLALPAVAEEVAHVRSALGGWNVSTDLAPTRDSLRAASDGCDLVHLAAHGSLRKDNPAYSFIELADGPLFVHDLSSFRLPGSAVVLTACSSGRGISPAGDEWLGLARGFLSAGASTVLASLWPIEDRPTLELMQGFYDSYATGLDVPRAMGAAMRAMRVHRPHPWHWASFACLGGVSPREAAPC